MNQTLVESYDAPSPTRLHLAIKRVKKRKRLNHRILTWKYQNCELSPRTGNNFISAMIETKRK